MWNQILRLFQKGNLNWKHTYEWRYNLKLLKWLHIKSTFFIMLTRGSCTKMDEFSLNIWVSTSVWESLLNTKNVHCLSSWCMSLTWASLACDEKSSFWWFSIVFLCFKHANVWASMCWLVKICNIMLFINVLTV